jgi:hypothetical protein
MIGLVGAWQARGLFRGTVIGLLLGIGWNTSSQTAALEGGHAHLTFGVIVGCGIGGAITGVVLASIFWAMMPRQYRYEHGQPERSQRG